jgi:allophanate hydrolase subunit 2
MFTPEGRTVFFSTPWRLSPNSDRMGFRFEGPPLELFPRPPYLVRDAGAGLADIVDDVIPLGGVQVAGGIEPIVMGVDVPSSGGYAKIATAISADMGVLGQLRPGEAVQFVPVTLDEAIQAGLRQNASISPDLLGRANTNGGTR